MGRSSRSAARTPPRLSASGISSYRPPACTTSPRCLCSTTAPRHWHSVAYAPEKFHQPIRDPTTRPVDLPNHAAASPPCKHHPESRSHPALSRRRLHLRLGYIKVHPTPTTSVLSQPSALPFQSPSISRAATTTVGYSLFGVRDVKQELDHESDVEDVENISVPKPLMRIEASLSLKLRRARKEPEGRTKREWIRQHCFPSPRLMAFAGAREKAASHQERRRGPHHP